MAMWLTHCCPEIRANAVCATLCNSMASRTLLENSFALGDIGSREQSRDRHYSDAAGIARCLRNNGKALFFRRLWVEIHARDDAQSKRDDAACQNPACNCVTTIIHCLSALKVR